MGRGQGRRLMDPLRVLIIGTGGREHALAWRLTGEADVSSVVVAPGNALIARTARVVPEVSHVDAPAIAALALAERADLVVIGPEAPLVAGVTDRLVAQGIAVCGPTEAAARLEASKAFCREIAEAAGVPMAEGRPFDAVEPALAYAARFGGRVAVKADGLAGGKGVTVCGTLAEAEAALRESIEDGRFGGAGRTVVVEEALEGPELSVIVLADASGMLVLPGARDHKRLADGDRGPNTGGMGAVSPAPGTDDVLVAELAERFHRPVLAELARRGTPFRGALFGGFMLTAAGPRLLEFNVRIGDPEAEAILPRLDVPLGRLLNAIAHDRLIPEAAALGIAGPLLPVRAPAGASIVLAAAGYPETVRTGDPNAGIDDAAALGGLVFGSGIAGGPDGWRTSGGRVLIVAATGDDPAGAAAAAGRAADAITFAGLQRRRDIGLTTAPMVAEVAR
jgi:phosphoribosylamine--glycine ligase